MASQIPKKLKTKLSQLGVRALPHSAKASALLPTSTVGCRNSQASLPAAAEVSEGLDFVLKDLDFEIVSDYWDFTNKRFEELEKAAKEYSNSTIDRSKAKVWSCNSETRQLIWEACCCSREVNSKIGKIYTDKDPLEFIEKHEPSILGTKKAFSIWRKGDMLIVAIRASKTLSDHIVNLAHNAKTTLVTAKELEGTHGAYLSCTEALIPDLRAIFNKRVRDHQIKHILFTGESSGGAVSSLLFYRFASEFSWIFEGTEFSLITFGCPPVTARDVTPIAERLPNTRMILSFVNEGDFVTLASKPYVQSVINLFRHTWGLNMIGDHASCETQVQASVQGQGLGWYDDTRVREWRLPEPEFYHIGKIVVLTSSLVNRTLLSPGCLEIEHCDFARLLFCSIDMHKGSKYMARIAALAGKESLSYGTF